MAAFKLSICIPTYNYGEFIGAALRSIIDQSSDEVEIVVLDGASTDNTPDIVQRYQQEFPRIRYTRLEKKGGVDKDIAATVDLAQGDYCWLMSSDDALKPGAIRRMLDEISSGNDVYLCNRTQCDRDLRPISDQQWLSGDVDSRTFTFSKESELMEYFSRSASLGALFSFLSSIIVKRSAWNNVSYNEQFFGTNYAHVHRLFTILLNGGVLRYIQEPLILCRGFNDSFATQGIVNRLLIDFNGYHTLASSLFRDQAARTAFRSVVKRQHRWYTLTLLRNHVSDETQWKHIEGILGSFGYSRADLFLINRVGSSGIMTVTANFLRRIAKYLMLLKARRFHDKSD